MEVGDRVTYDPRFVAEYGERFPFKADDIGEITDKSETRSGKTVYLVDWASEPWQVPQQMDESWLTLAELRPHPE
jgi:hypothetical protein